MKLACELHSVIVQKADSVLLNSDTTDTWYINNFTLHWSSIPWRTRECVKPQLSISHAMTPKFLQHHKQAELLLNSGRTANETTNNLFAKFPYPFNVYTNSTERIAVLLCNNRLSWKWLRHFTTAEDTPFITSTQLWIYKIGYTRPKNPAFPTPL